MCIKQTFKLVYKKLKTSCYSSTSSKAREEGERASTFFGFVLFFVHRHTRELDGRERERGERVSGVDFLVRFIFCSFGPVFFYIYFFILFLFYIGSFFKILIILFF